MKTIILTVEVKIDEKRIAQKYPNFVFNYDTKPNNEPTDHAMMDFAKGQVTTENSLRDFGFSANIVDVELKK